MPSSPSDLITRALAPAARLPWWAALLAALAAYALLHPIARLRLPPTDGDAGLAANAFAQLLISLAGLAQLLIPLALLLIAMASAYAAWRRYDIFTSTADDLTGGVLRGLSREELGVLLAEAFRRLGYRVAALDDPGSADSSRLTVTRDGKRFLVDFSHWKAWQVPPALVETLHDAIARAGADGGMAFGSGSFSADAGRLARDLGIELADGRRVRELIRARWDPFVAQSAIADPVDDLVVSAGEEDHKTVAGRAIAALIRAEERDAIGIDPSPPPSIQPSAAIPAEPILRTDELRTPLAGWGEPPREPTAPRPTRLRLSRIADAAGMLFAVALLWIGWQWLAALPSAPDVSPWGRLPLSSGPEVERAPAVGATEGRALRPIGEFHFGPRAGGDAPLSAADAPTETPGSLMPKLSVWELEAAFNASYIPPPECANWQSSVDMARCGNHRMRTLRAFIEGGGKRLPAMRGESLAATSPPEPDPGPRSAVPSWRDESGALVDPGWAAEEPIEPIPAGPLSIPIRDPEGTADGRPQAPITRRYDDRPPPQAPSWREEQARRESGDWGGEQDRLFVTPEDAEPDPGDWLRR